jgi:uncharacterized protein YhbP (UPF0306 family)
MKYVYNVFYVFKDSNVSFIHMTVSDIKITAKVFFVAQIIAYPAVR